jgi:transglutaminase-like putative cysteine protease
VDPGVAADGAGLRTRINGAVGPVLFAPAHPRLVQAAVEHLGVDEAGVLRPPPGAGVTLFGVVSGRALVTDLAEAERATLLAVPEGFAARVADLAARLGQGSDPGARVGRTLYHLGRECRYSLTAPKPRTSQPVADFLLETKQGYCEYFASAAALLLRLQGVPTRYVTGFNVRDESWSGGHYVVRESDAHAWIEAWLPGRGWVELDPTPSAQYAAVHGGTPGVLASIFEWLRGLFVELSSLIGAGDLRAVALWLWQGLGPWLAWAALAGAGLAAWRLGRWRPARSRSAAVRPATAEGVPPGLIALQARLDRLWSRHDAPRPPARAPREHALAIPAGRLPGALHEAGLEVVDCYYRARFGGHPPAAGEIDRLVERLQAAARADR